MGPANGGQDSGQLPNFCFYIELWIKQMVFRTLYGFIGMILAIVDNINRKYAVTMAMAHSTINMADTVHVLNLHFARGGK